MISRADQVLTGALLAALFAACSAGDMPDRGREGDYCYGSVACEGGLCHSSTVILGLPTAVPKLTVLCYRSDGLECDDVYSRCVRDAQQGESCWSDDDCMPGLQCKAAGNPPLNDAPAYCVTPSSPTVPAPDRCAALVPPFLAHTSAVPVVPIAPSTPTVKTVALGGPVSCAVMTDGTVKCWGGNSEGELGLGYTYDQDHLPLPLPPTEVPGIRNARSISASSSHVCAVLADGHVACWGLDSGLRGTSPVVSASPQIVAGLENAVSISVADHETCVLDGAGSIWCWGAIGHDGPGTIIDEHLVAITPSVVPGIAGAVSLSATTTWYGYINEGMACAILATGEGRCWGKGMLGQAGAASPSATPVAVANISDAVAVSGTCVLRAGGKVSCWGERDYPSGTVVTNQEPVDIPGIDSAVDIAADPGHACVLLASGHVRCWGINYSGSLGAGNSETSQIESQIPVEVCNISSAKAVFAAWGQSCALLDDGRLLCWGDNFGGPLGRGGLRDFNQPVVVEGL